MKNPVKTYYHGTILKLCEAGMMLALATVLSLFPLFHMPQGGSVTLCCTLPIIVIAYRHGLKWGLLTGVAFGLLKLIIFGPADLNGASVITVIGSIFFDYLFAFGALGLAALFRKLPFGLIIGTAAGNLFRGAMNVISGVIFWSNIVKSGLWGSIVFSVGYNFGGYIFWDGLIATVGALLLEGTAFAIHLRRRPS